MNYLEKKFLMPIFKSSVNDVLFDKDTFEITDLVIKKTGFSEQIKASENVIPMELVKVIGDKVLLKGEDDLL